LKHAPYPIKILHQTTTIRESVAWLTQHQPDLIFCDIHLEDGSAYDIFEKIEVNIPIIFTTAYDQYALKAFQQKVLIIY
jgi:two-component SAPR family response regulator